MHATTLSFNNIHLHGSLFGNMFRARHDVFIARNNWSLTNVDGMEYDQYDTPASRWIVIHDQDHRVLAGVRLTPTTARNGIYSYMIRDAQRGLLADIPSNIMDESAPVSPTIWEGTRIFVSQHVPGNQRCRVHLRLVQQMIQEARELNAHTIIGIIPQSMVSAAKRMRVDIREAGPTIDCEGILNVCVSINVLRAS
ncbi:MAG: acyl-homoserine-lactone synthase [Albidovulum sp.]